MSSRLEVKDLITIGVFSAVYVVTFFTTAMVGYVPVLLIVLPGLIAITTGIPFLLFLTRVTKFGMVSLLAIVMTAFPAGLSMLPPGRTARARRATSATWIERFLSFIVRLNLHHQRKVLPVLGLPDEPAPGTLADLNAAMLAGRG